MRKEEQHKSNINCLLKQYPECEETLLLCLDLLQQKYYRSQRTKDGIKKAKTMGKQIGNVKGAKLYIAKAHRAKGTILRINKAFCGMYNDLDTLKYLNVSRNSFYKYKKELKKEIQETSIDYCLRKYHGD